MFAGGRKNYCAKYNKLAGSDEIFCDEVGDVERWGDYGAEMMCELSHCSSSTVTTPTNSNPDEDYDWGMQGRPRGGVQGAVAPPGSWLRFFSLSFFSFSLK